jgi:hypothetical protein
VLDESGLALLSGRPGVFLEREVRPRVATCGDGLGTERLGTAPLVHPDDAPSG